MDETVNLTGVCTMKSDIDFHSFSDREVLVEKLADSVISLLKSGISKNGRASLAVSGGSTPVALFEELSVRDLAWDQVHVCLVDERWVEPEDPDSNEHLVRSHLLRNRAAAARFSGMKNSAATAGAGETECERLYRKIPAPYDVLLLGMGGDGHTASLFPGAVRLPQATDMESHRICIGIAPLTAPHERMTLSLPAILSSRVIILHITGQDKKDVLDLAMGDGPAVEMPIRFILQNASRNQKIKLQVYWAK